MAKASHIVRVNADFLFTAENVTKGNFAIGENWAYWYAPCEGECGRRLNVGNYPPVLESLNRYGVWCSHCAGRKRA